MSQPETALHQQASSLKKASLLQIFRAILWSLLGVRQHKAYENDITSITPMQAVVAALIGAAMFIATILTLVTLAIKYLS